MRRCVLLAFAALALSDAARSAPGSMDATFTAVTGASINATATQPDGRIVVGGSFTSIGGVTRNRLARLNADGSLDPAFNPNASPTLLGYVNAIVALPDGRMIVGGAFQSIGGLPRSRLAILNSEGAVDPFTFSEVNGDVRAIAFQADGKMIIGGDFGAVGGETRICLARFNVDGSLDAGFAPR